jgi:hypothetical protein
LTATHGAKNLIGHFLEIVLQPVRFGDEQRRDTVDDRPQINAMLFASRGG